MRRVACGQAGDTDRVRFQVRVDVDGDGRHELVNLWSLCGPGDDARPVITIMLLCGASHNNRIRRTSGAARSPPPSTSGWAIPAMLAQRQRRHVLLPSAMARRSSAQATALGGHRGRDLRAGRRELS